MDEKIKYIIDVFNENGIEIDEDKANKLFEYYTFLVEYNEKVNLTAVTEFCDVVQKHFADCASGHELIKPNAHCIDVGTGAGFPGMVLAIMRPDIKVCLMDSLNKRLVFLDELKERLNITNVYTVHGRSEELGHREDMRGKFDIAVSRAVARLNVLTEFDLPFVKKGGKMLAWKGPQVDDELKEASGAIKILGGEIEGVKASLLAGTEHNVVVISKKGDTPKKYPRQAGTPKKKPL